MNYREDCEKCDGLGKIYKHADPKSMQWVECDCNTDKREFNAAQLSVISRHISEAEGEL